MELEKRRKDYGKLRLSAKDLTGLDWVASMGTMRLDALAQLFSVIEGKKIDVEATRKVVQRWLREGWAEQQTFLKGMPPFVWLTKSGMSQTKYRLSADKPALSMLEHTSDLSFIRLDVLKSNPTAHWRSEREIRNIASNHSKGLSFPHLPDGEVIIDASQIFAIERERTAKTVERTRGIILELCSRKFDYDNSPALITTSEGYRYTEIIYYASVNSIKIVEKALSQIPASQSKKVRVILW